MLHMGKGGCLLLWLDRAVFNLGNLSEPQTSFFACINLENQQDIGKNQ